jgi:hypothetical protein
MCSVAQVLVRRFLTCFIKASMVQEHAAGFLLDGFFSKVEIFGVRLKQTEL